MEQVLLDTNIFLQRGEITELIANNSAFTLQSVIRELDKLKNNDEVGYHARKALHEIYDLNMNDKLIILESDTPDLSVDDQLINTAQNKNYTLYTNDLAMQIKANTKGVVTKEYHSIEEKYSGYRVVYWTQDEQANFYCNLHDKMNAFPNEYIVIRDAETSKTVDIRRWDNSTEIWQELLHPPNTCELKAKNDLQRIAIDMLVNPNIPLVFLTGGFGCGKSLLAAKIGYKLVEQKKYEKLALVRQENTEDGVGYLPGDLLDKTEVLFQSIAQYLPKIGNLRHFIHKGIVETHILCYIKGLNLDNRYIIVDESQELSVKEVERIGSRVAEGSKIVFIGDEAQQYSERYNTGLTHYIKELANSPLMAAVELDRTLRSDISSLFNSQL